MRCNWCKKDITDDCYYVCKEHGTILCDNCDHNFYLKKLDYSEAPKCNACRIAGKDSVFEKKYIEEAKEPSVGGYLLSNMDNSAKMSFQYLHPEMID